MKHRPVTLLTVFLAGHERRKVGRLAAQDRRILFEYDQDFAAAGLQLSPFKLPLKAGVQVAQEQVFDGLFGLFNDSLPDGWGRLLLDRAIEGLGVPRQSLTPLDRLAHVGESGMGALVYEPDQSNRGATPAVLELDVLEREAAAILKGEEGPIIEKLLQLNGASAGARPKVVALVSADRKRIIHGAADLPDGYDHWMIKFPSTNDNPAIGPIEYAYSLMARAAGVEMSETHLFTSKRKRYFGIRRFDRDGRRRIHMHSLSGLLHADHRVVALDYNTFLTVTARLTRDATETERAFRLACFNVLAHNRDDHAKNFSYLMDDRTGQWRLAPAYDLTFSAGPGGEQSMMVMGEGRAPGVEHLQDLAKRQGLKTGARILDEVRAAVANWTKHAEEAGVPAKQSRMIAGVIAPMPTGGSSKKQSRPGGKVSAGSKQAAKSAGTKGRKTAAGTKSRAKGSG